MYKANSKKAIVLTLLLSLLVVSVASFAAFSKDERLTILWAAWDPADQLEQMCKTYTEKTGVEVTVKTYPWDKYLTKTSVLMSSHTTSIDLLIADSQWKGWLVEGNHVVQLNDWIEATEGVDMDNYYSNLVKYYGEYPEGSGNYYFLPFFGDTEILYYRKDLFNDPELKEAFMDEYSYELKPPETWSNLRDMAKFFKDSDAVPYGLATKMSRRYDYITWDFNQVLWAFGGSFWNPETKRVDGYINSPESVEALEFYKSLAQYAPPGIVNYAQDEVVTAFQQGLVAMSIQWAAFAQGYTDCSVSNYCEEVGFAPTPKGPKGWYPTLGGQGIGVSAYTPNEEEAFKFLAWLCSEEAQVLWARDVPAGVSTYKPVMETEAYETYQPWYRAQKLQAPHMRDIWSIPEYSEILQVTQTHFNNVVAGTEDAQEALDNIAEEQEEILRKAGYYD